MSRINTPAHNRIYTHEGAPAKHITPEQQLRRSVLSCMLWEDEFYEDGESIADRITSHCSQVSPQTIAELTVEARTKYKLRHVPLLLLKALIKYGKGRMVGDAIYNTIQRPDELTELLAIYWKDGKCKLSAQLKKGLARAFTKFDAYQLAKYNHNPGSIKLRDVMFLCHPKPKNKEQEETWKRLVDKTLSPPDTWETRLIGGAKNVEKTDDQKRQAFSQLLQAGRLGYMALLRNLRLMQAVGVDRALVKDALLRGARKSKALPFRFIAAAQACPKWEDIIEEAMLKSCEGMKQLHGKTCVVVDASGSMDWRLSERSKMRRFDAAMALAILVREISDECAVYAYGTDVVQVPPRRGFGLSTAIVQAETGWNTRLGLTVKTINADGYDRAIIITDEQSHDSVPDPLGTGYIVNVASSENGVGYGAWNHIDGFSEAIVSWIQELES